MRDSQNFPSGDFLAEFMQIHANDVIMVTKTDQIDAPLGPEIVYCNGALEKVTGFHPDEVLGLTPRIFQVDESDRPERDKIRATLEAHASGGGVEKTKATLKNKKKNGDIFWLDLDLSLVRDAHTQSVYWLSVQRDITEHIRREHFAWKLLEAEVKLREEQAMTLANTSHDLRSPLNSILGYVDALLLDVFGSLSNRQKDVLSNVHESCEHMLNLVNELLDVTRGEQNAHTDQPLDFVLDDALNFALNTVSLSAQKARVNVNVTDARHGPHALKGDVTHARQCIINILDNALRFSPPESSVTVNTYENRLFVCIRISDSGPGMTPDELSIACQTFGQVASNNRDNPSGTGLGLPITIKLMEMSGGRVFFDTEKGSGTAVTLAFKKAGLAKTLT